MDTLTPEQRSERMSRIRPKDTKPEMAVRRLIHGMGYRYRLHVRDLPGVPDLTFRKLRKIIEVRGCYWHRHDCPSGRRSPKSRLEFWLPKFQQNVERDRRNELEREKLGYDTLVVWECEVRSDLDTIAERIRKFLVD